MYQLGRPDPRLARFIEHYWFVRATPERPFDLTVDVYVDARADLIFNFGVPYRRTVLGQRASERRSSNLDAQRSRPIKIEQRGAVVVSGVRFHTGGLAPFVATPLHEFTDRVVRTVDAFGRAATELEASLRACIEDVDEQTALLDAFFLARLGLTPSIELFLRAKERIEASRAALRIELLADELGVSTRHLDRLFRRHLGFSPKSLGRIVRFQGALARLMSEPEGSLASLAAECGYFDHSHFVRECRAFAGDVPKRKLGYFPPDAPRDFSPNLVRFVQDPPSS